MLEFAILQVFLQVFENLDELIEFLECPRDIGFRTLIELDKRLGDLNAQRDDACRAGDKRNGIHCATRSRNHKRYVLTIRAEMRGAPSVSLARHVGSREVGKELRRLRKN